MGNKRTPEMRLSGFSGDWEQCELGDILKVNSGRDYKHLQQGDIPVYGTGGYMLSVNDKLSDEDAIGIGRKGTIDKPRLLKAPFWTVDTLFYMTMKQKNDLLFCYSLANKIHWKKYDESTGVPSLSKTNIDKIPALIPTPVEQLEIGNLFKQLDDSIAIQEQELETIKQTKHGFLQKMFPKEGDSIPEVRFFGFSGDWAQRKLNELVTPIVREVPKPEEPYERISVRSHAKGTFHQKVDNPKTVAMKKLYVVKENDLIVNITFAWEHAIAVANKEDDGLLVSHRFPTFLIDKSDINFMRYTVAKENFRRKMELISPGGAGRNRVLNKKDFINLKIFVPKDIEEQTKIGNFFKQLDDIIALHEQELDTLKQTKKAFLQKVFA